MNKMEGTIKAVAKTGKSFKLDTGEDWYSVFNESQMNGMSRGDYVSFEFVAKGRFNNVKGNLRGTASGGASGGSESSSKPAYTKPQGRTFPVAALAPERTINRQNALTNAVAYANASPSDLDVHEVISIARAFEAYTTGDMDAEEAKAALEAMGAEGA